jgi:hypothetical protein
MDACPEQERPLAEEAEVWLAHKVMETNNPRSPDLAELATRAGAASHHFDSMLILVLSAAGRKTPMYRSLYQILEVKYENYDVQRTRRKM